MTIAQEPTAQQVLGAAQKPVNTLLLAMTLARAERERVDKIERRVLAEGQYYGWRHEGEQYRVMEPKDFYHMDNQSAEAYQARLQSIHQAQDPTLPEGHCPALVAERWQTEAEWALIEAAEPLFDITNNQLLCAAGGLERRQKYLDLLIGMVVNSPGFQPPTIPRP